MKQLSLLLALLGFSCGLYAQQTPFFTMQELRQLIACPTPECFKEAVRKKGYELHRKETTDGLTILTYHILTEGQNPAYPLHLITYGYKGPRDGRTIGFLTKSPSFPAWLDAELAEAGYTIDGPDNQAENRIYTRQEGAVRWRLSRYKPEYSPSAGGNSYQINLSGFRQPATPPTQSVAQQPSYTPPPAENSEPPHLGGDWDKNYPVQHADDLFRAERAYAADYERKHGKTGHTFSRAEKLRVQATYLNQLRPLTDDRWEKSFDLALRTTGFEAFANERKRLFKQESLFEVAGERVWLPTQEVLIASLQKEATRNVPITLYTVLVSHHDFGGTLHLSFLVNEFAAPKAIENKAQSALINDEKREASNIIVANLTSKKQLIPYRKDQKWGYCDVSKKIVIPCQYEYAHPFVEGLARVTINDKTGFINEEGKTVIPCKFGLASNFNKKGTAVIWRGNSEYDAPDARINKKGQVVNEKYCRWTSSVTYEPEFSDGMAEISEEIDGKRLYGFINEIGDMVIPYQFEKVSEFSEGFAMVFNGEKWAFIDKKGLFMTDYESVFSRVFYNEIAIITELNKKTYNPDRSGYMTKNFTRKYITGPKIRLHLFGEGLFLAEKDNKMGFVDKEGIVVIPFSFSPQDLGGEIYYGSVFKNGRAIVSKNNRLGMIDRKGQVVIPFIYGTMKYNASLDLYLCHWESAKTAPILLSGYMSSAGVKYWED